MNVEKILAVADAIEQHSIEKLGFNMNWMFEENINPRSDVSGHRCNSAACIAGWVIAVERGYEGLVRFNDTNDSFGREASQILEIDEDTAFALFFPINCFGHNGTLVSSYDATIAQAATVLRNLAETGKVDWLSAMDAD